MSQCRGIVITSHLTECFSLLASYCLPRPAQLVWLLLPDLLIILHTHPLPFHVHSCLCLKAAKGHFWGGGGEEADEVLVLPPPLDSGANKDVRSIWHTVMANRGYESESHCYKTQKI